ncbi:MAG: SDR family NAD(P)-dependent oxidoreductase [Cellvibrionaceae bacterium]|nr:SDR family NAD(P)-dependent oxidoreductase [Cellvibrionaceae bacterium]
MMESIWLTGASQGLGRALALELVRQGFIVYASARNQLALQELKQQVLDQKLSGMIVPKPLDIEDAEDVKTVLDSILSEGSIAKVILNAGTYKPVAANDFDCQSLRDLFELNVFGTVNCLEPAVTALRKQGKGQIAVVASLAAYRGLPKSAAYGASKAALIHIAESLYTELHREDIDIKVINPGFVKTPLTDKNDFAMPQRVEAEWAAKHIVSKLSKPGFEIRFPTPFAQFMGFLKWLPYGVYFPLIRKISNQ